MLGPREKGVILLDTHQTWQIHQVDPWSVGRAPVLESSSPFSTLVMGATTCTGPSCNRPCVLHRPFGELQTLGPACARDLLQKRPASFSSLTTILGLSSGQPGGASLPQAALLIPTVGLSLLANGSIAFPMARPIQLPGQPSTCIPRAHRGPRLCQPMLCRAFSFRQCLTLGFAQKRPES